MSGVETVEVADGEEGQRLDRWFKRRYPSIPHGRLEKWLRSGQVRVDGRRAKAGDHVAAGQRVRVPPYDENAPTPPAGQPAAVPSQRAVDELLRRVLYRDEDILVLDKPAGLAVQGGSQTFHHLDAMLEGLVPPGAERPRLVHRLDRDTSGVLVLARHRAAAAALGEMFQGKAVAKLYWAIVVGVPTITTGRIDQPLAKRGGAGRERMVAAAGRAPRAVTHYRVVEAAGRHAAWLVLAPLTGRTHQLRAHCAIMDTPILGDGKYGGRTAFLPDLDEAKRLHLHARAIRFTFPSGRLVTVTAPLPEPLRHTWRYFGFAPDARPEAADWELCAAP